jgi:hypothetical protein
MNTRMRVAIAAIAGTAALAAGGGAAALANPASAVATMQTAASTGFTWHPLHLVNGWRASSPGATGVPAYAVQNGVLYLRGGLIANRPKPSVDTFAVLPASVRPSHYLWISCANTTVAWTGTATGTLLIQPNGDMLITLLTNNAAPSLSGISFPLSS